MNQEDSVIWSKKNNVIGDCDVELATGHIFLWKSGYYHVSFSLYHQEACQFTLFMNEVVIDGTTTGSPTASTLASNVFIIRVQDSDLVSDWSDAPGGKAAKIELVNHTSFVPSVTLNGLSGSGFVSPQVVATMTVVLIA